MPSSNGAGPVPRRRCPVAPSSAHRTRAALSSDKRRRSVERRFSWRDGLRGFAQEAFKLPVGIQRAAGSAGRMQEPALGQAVNRDRFHPESLGSFKTSESQALGDRWSAF